MAASDRNNVDVINSLYEVRTRVSLSLVTSSIGTSISTILRQDPARLAVTLVNLSTNVIFVAPDSNVSATNGIRLDANGGSMSINVRNDFVLPGLEWSALATGAGSNLFGTQVLIAA